MEHKHGRLLLNYHLSSLMVSIHLTITYRFNRFSDCFIVQLNCAWQLYSGDRATKSMFDWSRSKFTSLWLINKLMPSWIWRSGIPWVLQQTCFSRQDGLQAGITLEEWQTVQCGLECVCVCMCAQGVKQHHVGLWWEYPSQAEVPPSNKEE